MQTSYAKMNGIENQQEIAVGMSGGTLAS